MDYLATKSWMWKGHVYPIAVGILTQAKKPDGYKSSQSSSIRFLPTEIQNAEKDTKTAKKQEI
jgi:hypothetical protein